MGGTQQPIVSNVGDTCGVTNSAGTANRVPWNTETGVGVTPTDRTVGVTGPVNGPFNFSKFEHFYGSAMSEHVTIVRGRDVWGIAYLMFDRCLAWD